MMVYNALKCLNCGDVLWSKHGHDFLVCSCGKCMNDGGNSYRRGYVRQPSEDMSVTTDDDFEKIREYLHRYNRYSKKYIKLKDMSCNWLQNTIDYILHYLPTAFNHPIFVQYYKEKLYRAENEIFIEEPYEYTFGF